MRPSSVPLERALVEGLLEAGLDVVRVGLVTTPMSYFAVGHLGAAGGVQVTASHNPPRYNGFKFSRRDARPVSGDRGIPELERSVNSAGERRSDARGRASEADVMPAYAEHVLRFLRSAPVGAKRRKVVVDAANGMGCIYRPILEAAGVDLDLLYFELDGTFPNHEPNPLKLENLDALCQRVRETGADLGVAFDGDADRAAFVDERGEPVGSDIVTALIAGELLDREPGKAIVYDLRSSRAVAEHIRAHGGVPVRERVGHSFIKATLREHHGIFGGELAGHYYFRDNYHADCSLAAVFEILNLLRSSGRRMSELTRAAAALREDARDQLRGRGQGGRDRRAGAAVRRRPDRLPGRDHGAVPGLVVQRAAVEHRAAAAAGGRGGYRREAGGEEGDPGRVSRRAAS